MGPSSCLAMSQLTKLYVNSEVRPESRRVNLLNLCDPTSIPEDWKQIMSEVDIGESPPTGGEKVIDPLQLKAFIENFLSSRDYDSSKVQIVLPEKISVRRSSVHLPREQIVSIYEEFIRSKVDCDPRDIVIHAVSYPGAVELPMGEISHEVTASPRERFVGNVSVTIQFIVNGEKERSLRVTGKVELFQNVVHTTRALQRNDIILETDIELQKMSVSDASDRFMHSIDQAVGKKVLRSTGLHQPLLAAGIEQLKALKRGASVTIIHEQAGLRLTAKGQAKEDGYIGSTIRVVNVMTNRMINCRILDATTVQVVQ